MAGQVQDLLTQAVAVLVGHRWPVAAACRLVGVPRSTWYWRAKLPEQPGQVRAESRSRKDAPQPHALTTAEVEAVLAVLADPALVDLSVSQAYWVAFDAGRLACSQSTFYRIARGEGLVGDRRPIRARTAGAAARAKPVAAAAAVHDLWSWDISELKGPGRVRYQLYLAVDVYSRYPIAWRIEDRATREYAVEMFTDAFTRHRPPRVLHSDNGTQMRSHAMADLLGETVTASFSRPHVSDDNPFSEALFKTIKYTPGMPEHFDDIEHARAWMADFLTGYARGHHHVGLNRYTPEQVFTGTAGHVQAQRQARLDQLYSAHPGRYRRPPQAPAIPAATGINLSKAA